MSTDQDDRDTPLVQPPDSFLDRAFAALVPWEGNVPYMYQCPNGVITIGVGCALPYLETALLLPLLPRATIVADYAAVRALPAGKVASFYESHTTSRLSAPAIRKLFDERCGDFLKMLQRAWPKWPTFPESARLGLLDMGFNLGTRALLSEHEWPTFNVGVRSQNWALCADQCHRQPPVSEARNLATAKLFLDAAAESRSP